MEDSSDKSWELLPPLNRVEEISPSDSDGDSISVISEASKDEELSETPPTPPPPPPPPPPLPNQTLATVPRPPQLPLLDPDGSGFSLWTCLMAAIILALALRCYPVTKSIMEAKRDFCRAILDNDDEIERCLTDPGLEQQVHAAKRVQEFRVTEEGEILCGKLFRSAKGARWCSENFHVLFNRYYASPGELLAFIKEVDIKYLEPVEYEKLWPDDDEKVEPKIDIKLGSSRTDTLDVMEELRIKEQYLINKEKFLIEREHDLMSRELKFKPQIIEKSKKFDYKRQQDNNRSDEVKDKDNDRDKDKGKDKDKDKERKWKKPKSEEKDKDYNKNRKGETSEKKFKYKSKEAKYASNEYKMKVDNDKLDKKRNFTGHWYINRSKGRDNMRKKEHASDWMFDRAYLRAYLRNIKRNKAQWYFQ